jgi:cytochrome c-type biogenesis protein CcmE
MYFALRFAVFAGIVIPYHLVRGYGSFLEQLGVVLAAVLLSHGAVILLRKAQGEHKEDEVEPSPLAKIGLTALVAVGGLGFLVYSGRASSSGYRMVDVLMKEPARWVEKEMKIHGWVEPGSIEVKIEQQETKRTFLLGKSGKLVKVHHIGPVPDTFKDASEVVAKGVLTQLPDGSYLFEASELMAKCPSKYEGAESNKKFEERPQLN